MRVPIPRFPAILPAELSTPWIRAGIVLSALAASAWFGYRPSMTLVALAYGAIGLGAVLRWPGLALPGLVLAAAFIPATIGTGGAGGTSQITVAMLGVLGLTGLWVARMLAGGRLEVRPSPANRPFLLLTAVALLSIVAGAADWSPWVSTKSNFLFVQLAQAAVFGLSGCAYWLLANDTHGRRMLAVLCGIVLALGAAVLLGWAIPPFGAVSARILFNGPVFRVWVVALATGFALFHTGLDRRWRIGLFGLAAGTLVAPLALWQNWASGWLPSVVVFGIVGVVWLWNRSQWLAVTSGGALAFGYLFYRIVLLEVTDQDYWSLDTRLIAWRGLVQMLEGRWLLGLGLASYWHYWRGELGGISYLDPRTGALHYTFDAKVNMHNNFMDVLGQMGIVGVVVVVWLIVALARHAARQLAAEPAGFGRAYAAACLGGLGGMVFAGFLGDWIWPFIYNIGLRGFTDAFLGWMLLGGLVVLERTRQTA